MEHDILSYAQRMQCQELHTKIDENTGLKAIVAIHNTTLGPALGGCRLIEYPSGTAAMIDAIRLAQGMTYKAAISNLPLGGGKMVVLKPKVIKDRDAFFKEIGQFVNSLNGKYITAVDSGTSVEDMDIVATQTKFVTSTSASQFSEADPSGMTAQGVLRGIKASVKFKLNKDDLTDLHITLQGLGHAGFRLAKLLNEQGARLTVFDINPEAVERCVKQFGAHYVKDLDALLATPCDVFAPNALGGIINNETIDKIKAPIIAGCANNQLAEPKHGELLVQRGILYAPDYVINAGGLIYVAAQFSHITEVEAKKKIDGIYDTLLEIYQRAQREKKPTNEIADTIAKEKL